MRRRRWIGLLIGAGLAITPAPLAAMERLPVLRVGVVEGSPPCSERRDGVWHGLAIDLWSRIASRENLAFQLSAWPSTRDLLEATHSGRVDVGVGCINISPERLRRYRFSLPFQEDGLAVMVIRTPLDLGRAFLGALLGADLLLLLGSYLLVIALLTALTWRVEQVGAQPATLRLGRLRSFGKLFQVLATGPGGNTIVETNRGNGIVIAAYLVRIVTASLLVGFLTVKVVEETRGRAGGQVKDLGDLRGLRVAVRPGSISESLIAELNRSAPPGGRIRAVPMASISDGLPLLENDRADALLADDLQLAWLRHTSASRTSLPLLALQGIRPESQGFALAPTLPEAMADRIDLAISSLKRSGVVSELRREAIAAPGRDGEAQGEQR